MRGEHADVAEHDRQFALQSPKLQILWALHQARDHSGRDVAAEGRADQFKSLTTLLAVKLAGAGEDNETGRKSGKDRVEDDAVPSVRKEAGNPENADTDQAEQRYPIDRKERKKRGQRQR